MDMDRGGENMTVDEAKEHLKRQHEHSGELPIVVEYPWWVTLRIPLILLGIAFVGLAAATLSLVVLQVRDTNRNDESSEVRACRDLFTADITSAGTETRAAVALAQAGFNEALINLSDGDDATIVDIAALIEVNAEIPAKIEAERAASDARDEWDAAGQPMPCPLPRG